MGNFEKPSKQFKRLFIAVDVKPDNSFLVWLEQIKKAMTGEEIRWARPGNYHITLRFLGDTNIELIPDISAALNRSALSHKPFRFSLSGIGVFRSLSYPKVFWIGIKKTEELSLIKESIDFQLQSIINSNVNADFKPHLTLGRMKRVKDIKLWKELISRYSDHDLIEVKVEEIVFYESILDKSGPVYKVLDAIPFSV